MHNLTIVICVVASAFSLVILASLISRWLFKPLSLTAKSTGDENLDQAQKRVETLDLELGILEELGEFDPATMNHVREELATAQMTRDLALSTHERQKAIMEPKQERIVNDPVVVRNPQRTTG